MIISALMLFILSIISLKTVSLGLFTVEKYHTMNIFGCLCLKRYADWFTYGLLILSKCAMLYQYFLAMCRDIPLLHIKVARQPAENSRCHLLLLSQNVELLLYALSAIYHDHIGEEHLLSSWYLFQHTALTQILDGSLRYLQNIQTLPLNTYFKQQGNMDTCH